MRVYRISWTLRALGCLTAALLFAQSLPVLAQQAAEASSPRTASGYLEVGERAQLDGNHAAAAQAYRQAFEALAPSKRAQNEGARAALLSAGASWDAFAEQATTQHLADALAILQAWQNAAGPNPTASSASRVDRLAATLNAVHEPLALADLAVAQGNYTGAGAAYARAFEALIAQKRDAVVLERLAQRVATTFIEAYEQGSTTPSRGEAPMQALESGLALMRRYAGYAPGVGAAAADIERRRKAAIAEQSEPVTAEPVVLDPEPQPETPVATPEPTPARVTQDDRAQPGLAAPVAVVSVGVALLATGAGFLGDGLHQRSRMNRELRARDEESAELEASLGSRYDAAGYATAREEAREANARRNTGFIAAGSVLLAAGATTTIVGAVLLARRRASGEHARLRVDASASRSRLSIGLSGRF